ncbi:MAG TPA: hypothetical protein VGG51_08540 [Candidatus Cybelea sp.]
MSPDSELRVLVDQDLAAQGSSATCSREDVRAALDYLASPLVGCITRDGDAVVVIDTQLTGARPTPGRPEEPA